MATYAIGDLQGCYDELQQLLETIKFDSANDQLWFTGDLVNRGPKSLDCLRFIKSLKESAITVLGNHDLHLLAVAEGFKRIRKGDTLEDILIAPDREELLFWLRHCPLLYKQGDYLLVHAGVLPLWTGEKALALANEVEVELKGSNYRNLFASMYGDQPDQWRDELFGKDRLRIIINTMTRLRFMANDGRINFEIKGEVSAAPVGYLPWFDAPERKSQDNCIIFGHWSALGLKITPNLIALDSGCVWGGKLTAVRLEDRAVFQISCNGYSSW